MYQSMPANEAQFDGSVRYVFCEETGIVVSVSEGNTLTFINLRLERSQSIQYKSGKIISIAARGDQFTLLVSTY